MIVGNREEFLTLAEAARELRLSVSTLKRYIYSGHLRTYRTPGGRHRVRREDLEALLGVPSERPSAEIAQVGRADAFAEEVAKRVEQAVRRRLATVEMEIERLECSLDAISAAIRHRPQAPGRATSRLEADGCQIKVLGPGCRACDRLAGLVSEIAQALGLQPEAVCRVKELEDIAEYGPTPMPAVVVNDQVVIAGRLPSKSQLTELLQRHRARDAQGEVN